LLKKNDIFVDIEKYTKKAIEFTTLLQNDHNIVNAEEAADEILRENFTKWDRS